MPQNEPQTPLTMVMEDYLEAVYEISLEGKAVRVRDIARKMDVKMPTVTSMLKNLSKRDLVEYEKYEYVALSPAGEKVAKEMHRRHALLQRFLTEILHVDRPTADAEACRMEHALSGDTLSRLVDFMSYIHDCPRTGESWLERFDQYRRLNGQLPSCHAGAGLLQCEIDGSSEKTDCGPCRASCD